MKHLRTFEGHIEQDLGWLDKDGMMGALYDPHKKVMYIGSGRDENLNFTIPDIQTTAQADEVIGILRDVDHKEWEKLLKDSGFELMDGGRYSELTK